MKIFFDLDGTLLNSMERLHKLFLYLVPESRLSFDEYWNYKKNKIGHPEILKNNFFYTDSRIEAFKEDWLKLIETPQWLEYDLPFEGVTSYLTELKKKNDLYLVTARQFEDRALSQLEQYGWLNLFNGVFVTGGNKEKYDMIREHVVVDEHDWFIGDTGKDIKTGKKLEIKTAAVTSGFLNREKLAEYGPDIIIENILQFKMPL